MYYSIFSGDFWVVALILLSIYFYLKLSRLSARVDKLESGREYQAPARIESSPSVAPGVAPMPAPAPAPSPAASAVSNETKEEQSARWLGWTGAVMLILGVSFFLKYAFDHWIGPAGQVATGVIGGLAMLFLAQWLRAKYLKYSDMLFGAGVGILYLSLYAGFAFYNPPVIAQSVAFLLMMLVTALALTLAVYGGTMSLAVLGALGGFLTPVLLSTGENHLVTLSLYMIVLNVGVLGVALYKKWLPLLSLAFIGTVLLFNGWADAHYTQAQFGVTFLFVTIFFLIFLANSVAHHFVRKEPSGKGDLALLLANAFGYFIAGYALLDPVHAYAQGFFALVLALAYFALAYGAFASNKGDRTLNLFLPGIAVVFVTIAVPIQLSGPWIAVAWLAEAVVLVYVGLFLRERVVQVFGWIVLFLGTALALEEANDIVRSRLYNMVTTWPGYTGGYDPKGASTLTPFANSAFFLLMFGVAAYYSICALYVKMQNPDSWKKILAAFLLLGNLLTLYALTVEVSLPFEKRIAEVAYEADKQMQADRVYRGEEFRFEVDTRMTERYETERSIRNSKDTAVSILWAIYAVLLLVVGFVRRVRVFRLFGLALFFVTMFRVLIMVWDLGQLYRILSTISVGVIALSAAFLYVKHRDRLKEIL